MSPLTNAASTRDWLESTQEFRISAYLEPMVLELARPGFDAYELEQHMVEGYREGAAATLAAVESAIWAQSEIIRGAD